MDATPPRSHFFRTIRRTARTCFLPLLLSLLVVFATSTDGFVLERPPCRCGHPRFQNHASRTSTCPPPKSAAFCSSFAPRQTRHARRRNAIIDMSERNMTSVSSSSSSSPPPPPSSSSDDTKTSRKDLIRKLLKGIETGDAAAAAVVNESKYVQHNPQTREGGEGLAALFRRLSKTNPRVNVVRAFEDGDFVFGHTEYDFSTRRIGFEVFRFEGNQAVEHWDNIQPRATPELNAAGHSMVDGPVDAVDLDRTEANRDLVSRFVQDVMIRRKFRNDDVDDDDDDDDAMAEYVEESYVEHDPRAASDGRRELKALLSRLDEQQRQRYERIHRVLAEGSFVLAVTEGTDERGIPTSYYDLFRVSHDLKIAEHWNTIEAIPPRSEWKNQNGKF